MTLPLCSIASASFSGMTAAAGMLPLSTNLTNIVDAKGTIYRITGTALGGFQSVLQPDGTWNYPYRTITVSGTVYEGLLDRIAAAGFNTLRVLICEDVCYAGVKPLAYVNPTFNPDWFSNPNNTATVIDAVQILDSVVAYCGRLGLRVIFDMHALAPNGNNAVATGGLWYTTSTPGAADSPNPWSHSASDLRNEADWINAWVALATRYAGNPIVIGADLVNEPYNATWGDGNPNTDVCAAYTRCANAIQAANPQWLFFCQGIYETLNFGATNGGWVGIPWGAGLNLAQQYPVAPGIANQVVYSPHDYGPGVNNWNWFNVAAYPGNMPAVWDQMWGSLVKNDFAPVYIGEIGDMLVSGANNGYETSTKFTEAQQWVSAMMSYTSGQTSTNGTPDVPAGSAGFSWSWFCWSTNGYSGTPGSIINTDLLMGDYNTLNTNVMGYIQSYLQPLLLTDATIAVTISLNKATTETLSIQWATQNGTAIAGTHYVAGSGVATIATGQSSTTVNVKLIPLTASSPGSLYFNIGIGSGTGYKLATSRATVTIGYS